ncbi:MAG: hypothetical protein AB7F28_02765 [Candidatus Margulisiibacteriota bacterium]
MQPLDFKTLSIQDLATVVATHLQKNGIDAVLVGGSCVTIYAHNEFMSYDLDFISYDPIKGTLKAMETLGFLFDKRKYFTHPDCPFFIEFLNPPIAIGNTPIDTYHNLNSGLGELKLLTPTDCVKDRLAAYYHWQDKTALHQAIAVAKAQPIDIKDVQHWSQQEHQGHLVNDFLKELGHRV